MFIIPIYEKLCQKNVVAVSATGIATYPDFIGTPLKKIMEVAYGLAMTALPSI
ncbi:MAG: hypothetical protein ABII64_08245 [Elusimicrobiota bacterium]